MACSMTVDAVKAGTKTVTRRHAGTWAMLKPGDRLVLIERGMGLPKGAKQVVLAEVTIVSNEIVDLDDIDQDDCAAEGFPDMTPEQFVDMWCESHHIRQPHCYVSVRRIEWVYERVTCPECHNQFNGRMPGHAYGSNWDWVPCQTCHGDGLVDAA
jgi:hypothetical protein